MPFERFVAERITTPLGMVDTGYDVDEAKRGRLAKVYSLDKANALVELPETQLAGVYPEPGRGFAAGGAGMFSTIGDYVRFGQMLLNGGELDGVRILGRKTVELMMANHLNHLAPPTTDVQSGRWLRPWRQRPHRPGQGQPAGFGRAVRLVRARRRPTSISTRRRRRVVLVFAQHFPFNQHGLFWQFSTLMYAALVD